MNQEERFFYGSVETDQQFYISQNSQNFVHIRNIGNAASSSEIVVVLLRYGKTTPFILI